MRDRIINIAVAGLVLVGLFFAWRYASSRPESVLEGVWQMDGSAGGYAIVRGTVDDEQRADLIAQGHEEQQTLTLGGDGTYELVVVEAGNRRSQNGSWLVTDEDEKLTLELVPAGKRQTDRAKSILQAWHMPRAAPLRIVDESTIVLTRQEILTGRNYGMAELTFRRTD